MRDKYQNRMAEVPRKREEEAPKEEKRAPIERLPIQFVTVETKTWLCPACGSTRRDHTGNGNGGSYYWCGGCGSKIARKNDMVWIVG